MRKIFAPCLVLVLLLVSSCLTGTPPPTPLVVTVASTSAAAPWLTEAYACAGTATLLSRVDDPSAADISLRVGEPEAITVPAFQIDTEEILIVTNRQSPVQNMTLDQVRLLFEWGDPSAQVWVYASSEDIQKVFDQFVMEGRSVVSSAKLAVDPQQMSDTLVNESNAVGILPRHWKAGDVRDVYSVAKVPVLALTKSEPQGVVKDILACLQK